jgi:hypothetical protein
LDQDGCTREERRKFFAREKPGVAKILRQPGTFLEEPWRHGGRSASNQAHRTALFHEQTHRAAERVKIRSDRRMHPARKHHRVFAVRLRSFTLGGEPRRI